MSAKQITKRCHWVPQAYLKAFATDKSQLRVWRLGKQALKPELKRIDKVAVRFNLYVPKHADGTRDDSFEHRLAELEQWFDNPVWHSLRNGYVDLGWKPLRMMVSLLAAVMFLRNPKTLTMTRNMHKSIVETFSSLGGFPSSIEVGGRLLELDQASWPAYRDSSEDDQKRLWIAEMGNAAHYAKIFMEMRWSVICAEQPVFITTDNPIVFIHPTLTFRGIRNPDTIIYFPISPTRFLCFDHRYDEPANQYYPLRGSAVVQNGLMWRYALDHIFCHRHPSLVCTEIEEDFICSQDA